MEPVVVLMRLPVSVDTPQPLKTSTRRRKNRKYLFDRRKSPKHCDKGFVRSFCGWPSEDGNFHGFTNQDLAVSHSRCVLASPEGEDLVTSSRTAMISISPNNNEMYTFHVQPVCRRRPRVLSLCDGIATGLYVLHKMNIHVDTYFSSEICSDAILVQRTRFPGEIVLLGDLKKIDENTLDSLGFIHILIAGPPCSDLSMVNASRREWDHEESTAFLSIDVAKIRNYLRKRMYEARSPFMWFVEQTAHIAHPAKQRLVSEMGCQPEMICSSSFVPTFRRRLYFSNIPGVAELAARVKRKLTKQTLQEYLDPYSYALVNIAPTLTSNPHSQQYPVMEHGVRRKLNTTEAENLMGFDKNFTACGNLSQQKRLALVGRAWCCTVIQAIWGPFAEMFS